MTEWSPKEIKAFRTNHNLLQKDLAGLLGVTRGYVNYLEKGVRQPSKTLRLFLDCLEREYKALRKGKEKGNGDRNI
jgi:transcriptional regulator with XRE-family HTH domain